MDIIIKIYEYLWITLNVSLINEKLLKWSTKWNWLLDIA